VGGGRIWGGFWGVVLRWLARLYRPAAFGFPGPLRSRWGALLGAALGAGFRRLPGGVCRGPFGLTWPALGRRGSKTQTGHFANPTRPPSVLKGKPTIEGRPGASLPSMNLDSLESRLREKYGARGISKRDVLSAALYPKASGTEGSFLFRLLGGRAASPRGTCSARPSTPRRGKGGRFCWEGGFGGEVSGVGVTQPGQAAPAPNQTAAEPAAPANAAPAIRPSPPSARHAAGV
jgi:hypothetical protein